MNLINNLKTIPAGIALITASCSGKARKRSPFLLCMWLEEPACLRVGSVQVNSTSVGAVWFSELAKLESLRPLHSDSSEKVRCRVRLGDCGERGQRSWLCTLEMKTDLIQRDAHWVSLLRLSRVVHDDQFLQVVFDGALVGPSWGAQVPQRRSQSRLSKHVL